MDFNLIVQYERGYMEALKEIQGFLGKLGEREAKIDLLIPGYIAVKTDAENVITAINEQYVGNPDSVRSTKRWIPVGVVCPTDKILDAAKEFNDELVSKDKYAILIDNHANIDEAKLKEELKALLRGTYNEDVPDKFLHVIIFDKISAMSLLRKHALFER